MATGVEPKPGVMLSAGTTVLAVVFESFCWTVSTLLRVVYPPIGPVNVGDAVTKTIVMLLGVDALDCKLCGVSELSAEAIESDVSEIDCANVPSTVAVAVSGGDVLPTPAMEIPVSTLDWVALEVSRGGKAAVTCNVVATVDIMVVCE